MQPAISAPMNAHEFTFENLDGGALPLSQYAGRPILLVNTASLCGFTRQYAALQEVWMRFRDRGLVVLGVPSDDFGGQGRLVTFTRPHGSHEPARGQEELLYESSATGTMVDDSPRVASDCTKISLRQSHRRVIVFAPWAVLQLK